MKVITDNLLASGDDDGCVKVSALGDRMQHNHLLCDLVSVVPPGLTP